VTASDLSFYYRDKVRRLIKAAEYKDDPKNYALFNYTSMYEKYRAAMYTTPALYYAAVCQLHTSSAAEDDLLQHFPHLMQLLYQCIDYWLTHSNYTAVLLHSSEKQEKFLMMGRRNNEFSNGVLSILESRLGLKIMSLGNYLTGNSRSVSEYGYYYHPNQTVYKTLGKMSQGFLFQRSHEWNNLVYDFIWRKQQVGENPGSAVMDEPGAKQDRHPVNLISCGGWPRISILNRQKSRSILNSEKIAAELTGVLRHAIRIGRRSTKRFTEMRSGDGFRTPTVFFFEKTTFEDQANYFSVQIS
jgi:hypothetical protein